MSEGIKYIPPEHKRCKGVVKSTGERCPAHRMKGHDYCFFHEPKMAERHAEARSKGGKVRKFKNIDFEAIDSEGIDDYIISCLQKVVQAATEELETKPENLNTITRALVALDNARQRQAERGLMTRNIIIQVVEDEDVG